MIVLLLFHPKVISRDLQRFTEVSDLQGFQEISRLQRCPEILQAQGFPEIPEREEEEMDRILITCNTQLPGGGVRRKKRKVLVFY